MRAPGNRRPSACAASASLAAALAMGLAAPVCAATLPSGIDLRIPSGDDRVSLEVTIDNLAAAGFDPGFDASYLPDIGGDGIRDLGLRDRPALVLYGRVDAGADVDAAALRATDGFRVTGVELAGDRSGVNGSIGDLDGDGFDELALRERVGNDRRSASSRSPSRSGATRPRCARAAGARPPASGASRSSRRCPSKGASAGTASGVGGWGGARATVNVTTGLEAFLCRALVRARRERYLGLLARPRGRRTFLASLNHDFVRALDRTYAVGRLDDAELDRPGELYRADGTTSVGGASVRELRDEAPWEGGWLLIDAAGTLGIHRPEGRADDEVRVRVPTAMRPGERESAR